MSLDESASFNNWVLRSFPSTRCKMNEVDVSRSAVYTLPSDIAVVATARVHHVNLWISPKSLHGTGMRPRVSCSPSHPSSDSSPHHDVLTSYTNFGSSCTERCAGYAVVEYRKNHRWVVSAGCWGIATRRKRKAVRDANVRWSGIRASGSTCSGI